MPFLLLLFRFFYLTRDLHFPFSPIYFPLYHLFLFLFFMISFTALLSNFLYFHPSSHYPLVFSSPLIHSDSSFSFYALFLSVSNSNHPQCLGESQESRCCQVFVVNLGCLCVCVFSKNGRKKNLCNLKKILCLCWFSHELVTKYGKVEREYNQ